MAIMAFLQTSLRRASSGDDQPPSASLKRTSLKPALHMMWRSGSVLTPTELDVAAREWSVESSKALYNTAGWGAPYFDVNAEGHLVVRPTGGRGGREGFKRATCKLDAVACMHAHVTRNVGATEPGCAASLHACIMPACMMPACTLLLPLQAASDAGT